MCADILVGRVAFRHNSVNVAQHWHQFEQPAPGALANWPVSCKQDVAQQMQSFGPRSLEAPAQAQHCSTELEDMFLQVLSSMPNTHLNSSQLEFAGRAITKAYAIGGCRLWRNKLRGTCVYDQDVQYPAQNARGHACAELWKTDAAFQCDHSVAAWFIDKMADIDRFEVWVSCCMF